MKKRIHPLNSSEGIIIRSINNEPIFIKEEDKKRFLSILRKFSLLLNVSVLSYALCRDHVRFEIRSEIGSNISDMVKRVCISYVQHYFNIVYHRKGSLFQARYISFYDDENESINKQIISYQKKDTSYEATIKTYMGTVNELLNTTQIRAKYTMEEYIRYVNTKDRLSLTMLAYTPDDNTIKSYLLNAGGKECYKSLSVCDLIRVVRNLRKNHVRMSRIASLMGVSIERLKIKIS